MEAKHQRRTESRKPVPGVLGMHPVEASFGLLLPSQHTCATLLLFV